MLPYSKDRDIEFLVKNTIEKVFKINSKALVKSPECIRFIAQLASKRISIPVEYKHSDKKAIKYLFKRIVRIKYIPMSLILWLHGKLGNNFWRFSKTRLITTLIGLITLLSVLFVSSQSSTDEYKYLSYVTSSTIVLILFMEVFITARAVSRQKSLQDKNERVVLHLLDTDDDYSLSDPHSIILWYLLCKELNYEKQLKKILPAQSLKELEFSEALLNRDFSKLKRLSLVVKL